MDYWKLVVGQAWADTWAIVVGNPYSVLLVSVIVFIVSMLIYRKWAGAEAMKEQLIGAASGLASIVLVGVAVFVFNVLFIAPKKLYQQALEKQQHEVRATSPAFSNMIHLLQAFRMYRIAIGHDAECTVYVTAAPDSVSTASLVAQVSIATSNCATFGPHGAELTSTLEKEALEGAVQGVVIVHAPENDKAADELMNNLTHVFRAKRGSKPIPKGRIADGVSPNHVWLQFGANTRFASELRESEATKPQ